MKYLSFSYKRLSALHITPAQFSAGIASTLNVKSHSKLSFTSFIVSSISQANFTASSDFRKRRSQEKSY